MSSGLRGSNSSALLQKCLKLALDIFVHPVAPIDITRGRADFPKIWASPQNSRCHRTKLVATATWHPGFMHPWYHLSIYVQSCDSKRAWGFRDLQAEKCREWLLISLCGGVAWYELFASSQL